MSSTAPGTNYTGLPNLTWIATSAFNEGDQLKMGTRARTVQQMGTADTASKCIGVSSNTGLTGDNCSFVPVAPLVTLTSDGTAAISVADIVGPSVTTAGQVLTVGAGTGGTAIAAEAVANGVTGKFAAFWFGAAEDIVAPTSTLNIAYNAGSAAADQTMLVASGKGGAVVVKGSAPAQGAIFSVKDSASDNLLLIQDNALTQIASGAPDGAGTVATVFDTVNNLATVGAKLISFRNNTIEKVFIDRAGQVILLDNLSFGGASASFFASGTSMKMLGVGGLSPNGNNNAPIGTSVAKWSQCFSQQYSGTSQTVAFSATPAFNPANGETILNGPVTGNITGATISNGSGSGQRITIHFLKDATAGAYTIAFAGTNVRAFTSAFTTTASIIVKYSFVWNDQLATAAWVQDAAALVGV